MKILVAKPGRQPGSPGKRIGRSIRIEQGRDHVIAIAVGAELIQKRKGESLVGVETPSADLALFDGKTNRAG